MPGEVHVMITPWALGRDRLPEVVTWCGLVSGTPAAKDAHVATKPQAVTCDECVAAMRSAYATLSEWLPRIGKGERTE